MATTTTITTNYQGEFAGRYIGAGLLEAESLKNGIFTVRPNIKYKSTTKTVSIGDDFVTDATCDFDESSSVTLNERILEPKELQVNLTQCKKDFRQDWDALSMGIGAFDQLPKKYSDFIIARFIAKAAAKTEVDLYSGDSSNNGEFDGIEKLIAADANLPSGQEVAGTNVTASNVITELGKIVDAAPARLRIRPDVYIAVAPNIYYAYVRALGGFAANGVGANGVDNKGTTWFSNAMNLNFDGVPVLRANGMSTDTAILTYQENIEFGTGLLNDHNEVKLLDMSDIDGSQNVRFVMRYTAGTQYGFAEDIVTYGITNSAN